VGALCVLPVCVSVLGIGNVRKTRV
jgi:hypothetical protein